MGSREIINVPSKERGKGSGKRRIEIKRLEKEEPRMVAFSKRRQGLFKKAEQFYSLTGFSLAFVVFSPTGRIYTHGNPSFDRVMGSYLEFMEKKERAEKEKRERNEVISWLSAIGSREFDDDVADLVLLKKKLNEIIDKVGKKIDDLVH